VFEKMNIACLPISEYLEEDPLGRAEWIRLIGTILGCQQAADDAFNAIEKSYLEAKKILDNPIPFGPRPSVFFASREGDIWYSPPGNSAIGHLINDAGGNYLFRDSITSSNIRLTFEQLITSANDAEYWGNLISSFGQYSLEKARNDEPRLRATTAFKEGKIFYCNSSETDYFGDALMEPDILLKDLIKVFNTSELPNYRATYFKIVK